MNAITLIIYTIVVFCIGFATAKSFILSELRRAKKIQIGEFLVFAESQHDNKTIDEEHAIRILMQVKYRDPNINIESIMRALRWKGFIFPSNKISDQDNKKDSANDI